MAVHWYLFSTLPPEMFWFSIRKEVLTLRADDPYIIQKSDFVDVFNKFYFWLSFTVWSVCRTGIHKKIEYYMNKIKILHTDHRCSWWLRNKSSYVHCCIVDYVMLKKSGHILISTIIIIIHNVTKFAEINKVEGIDHPWYCIDRCTWTWFDINLFMNVFKVAIN